MNGRENQKSTCEFAADAGKSTSWQCAGKGGRGLIAYGGETPETAQRKWDTPAAEITLETCNPQARHDGGMWPFAPNPGPHFLSFL